MYRISDDARVRTSADKILSGLETCLERMPLAQISVSELCKQSGTGRATFYRLFDTIADILHYYCDISIKSACARIAFSDKKTVQTAVLDTFRTLMKHPLILDAIMTNNRFDLIYHAYLDYETQLKEKAAKIIPKNQVQFDYLVHMTNAILTAALQVWYHHGKKDSCEDIYHHIKNECKLVTELL